MTSLRYLFGSFWCLLVWLLVAVFTGFVLALAFPPAAPVVVGLGLDWRNLPGTLLGLLAARQSWRTHVAGPVKK
jgi:hypothetical protein